MSPSVGVTRCIRTIGSSRASSQERRGSSELSDSHPPAPYWIWSFSADLRFCRQWPVNIFERMTVSPSDNAVDLVSTDKAVDVASPAQPTTSIRRTDSSSTPYASALSAHAARETLALFVPGHGADGNGLARSQAEYFGSDLLSLDVPPLTDRIDLGEGSPKHEALLRAAEAWGARRTWFLTNGSTQGNRMAALALSSLGPDILMQRSAHSSFVDGIILAGLRPRFIEPNVDQLHGIAHGVTVSAVRAAFEEHPGSPRAVYIVSPSYFGAVADIPAIAAYVHSRGAALVVDAAWGAHFGFLPELPHSPVRLGADIMVTSVHKLSGSLTQSAILHVGHGGIARRLEPAVERAFSMTASTSESSLLLASLDLARHALTSETELIRASLDHVLRGREELRCDGRFPLLSDDFTGSADVVDIDPFRLPLDIRATGLDGHTVRSRLAREHGIYVEMATSTSIVAVVGIGKFPDLNQLRTALHSLADERRRESFAPTLPVLPRSGATVIEPRQAFFSPVELVSADEAIGRISVDSLAAYPPGIPNVLPGERITSEIVDFLREVAALPGGYVRGSAVPDVSAFRVVASTSPTHHLTEIRDADVRIPRQDSGVPRA